MNATEPLTEEAALWASIDAMPGDQLRRLVLADWYDERAGSVKCGRCKIVSGKAVCPDCVHWRGRVPKDCRCRGTRRVNCPACSGTGFIPNGYADMAAALRSTADRVPYRSSTGFHCWVKSAGAVEVRSYFLKDALFCELAQEAKDVASREENHGWADYPTAADAIRDLCRACARVYREGTT